MIISFKNLNGGGGGGGYVLPTATANRLGGVKIGDGINVENDGTISVSGSNVANYAMALKNTNESDGNNFRVVNESGYIYYIDDYKNSTENVFVKVRYNSETVNIYMNIDGQTNTEITDILNDDFYFRISIDSEGNLYYVNENDDDVYYNSEVVEYHYGDFTFWWSDDGTHIEFLQQAHSIEVNVLTDNAEYWYCVGQDMHIANQDQLGLVKIGEGIDLSEDGTISVQGGGDSTKLVSVSELPLTANTGDVYAIGANHSYPRCQIEDNNMNTISVGEYAIGNEEKLYVNSEMADDKLVLQYGDYYGYKLYIYGGQDQHFRFDVYLGDSLVDNGDIYQGATGTTEFSNESVTFNLNFEGESLEITISTPQGVPFTVFYNQEHKEMFLNEGPLIGKDSGERAALDSWYNGSYGNHNRHIVFLYYGELPQNEILFKVRHNQWSNDTYWSWDGEKLCAWSDENMSNRNEGWDMLFNTNGFVDSFYIYNFTEGVLSIASRELEDAWELYGDWYKYDEMTYEPIDWQNKVNNIKSFALPLAYGKINGVAFLGAGDINLNGVPDGGNVGQVLKKANDGFAWSDLTKDLQVVGELPPFADEGSVAIVNSIAYAPSNAFLAANTTNPNEKNNFNDNTEISHIGNGNYIYFDSNSELSYSTAMTFLFRIAMRTDENSDWNTSNIAYINVYREYDSVSQEHFYSWDMPPFDYKDDQGNDFTYSDSGTVDSSTTANTTSYLPLWKWWDGTYGYKFTFEYDNVADTLKVWLNHSSVDQIQGENYGDVDYRCQNHTKEFCEFNTDPTLSEVYVFKGGAWYKLGDLTSSI